MNPNPSFFDLNSISFVGSDFFLYGFSYALKVKIGTEIQSKFLILEDSCTTLDCRNSEV